MKVIPIFLLLIHFATMTDAQTVSFKKYTPCTFSIDLPVDMKIKKMFSDNSPDYCDYEVRLRDGYVIMELHSLISSRFEQSTIKELYNAALRSSSLDITYKAQSSNFFVISGYDRASGNIVYWKRVLGNNFVSDMHIEYDENRRRDIEPHLGRISKSFVSY